MERREFLVESARAALSLAAVCVSGCFSREQTPAGPNDAGVKDTGTNEPVDNDTVFAACSNTKPVLAYGVLKLCEQGVLELDTPLTSYTSRRVTADPRIELITTRHVLNHTTGFPNWRQGPELPNPTMRTASAFPESTTRARVSRNEMLRPQIQERDRVWEGLARALEQHERAPIIFAHSGQDAGYYCVAAGCTERRSGFMVMFNGDAIAPLVWNMLVDPSGPPPPPDMLWSDFVRRFSPPEGSVITRFVLATLTLERHYARARRAVGA